MYDPQDDPQSRREREIDAAWAMHKQSRGRYKQIIRRGWLERHIDIQIGLCAYCGIRMLERTVKGEGHRRATIDHIRPLSKGGPDCETNTLAACRHCNQMKSDQRMKTFLESGELFARAEVALNGPDRLSGNEDSLHFDGASIERGVMILRNGQRHLNTVEYCVSEGWIRSTLPRTKDRWGNPMTGVFKGEVAALYRDNMMRVETMKDGSFAKLFRKWLASRCFRTGKSRSYLHGR